MAKSVVLCILDGWGHRENGADNAISCANTPHWDAMVATAPHTLLEASELDVGLPQGQMGNSEVGHMNIGSGQLILQDLPRIDQAVEQNTLQNETALKGFIQKLKESKGTCNLLGLLSPGGIHSHIHHILALAKIISRQGITVALHAFLDGRDMPPKSAESDLSAVLEFTKAHRLVKLSSMGGRFYGMDRDQRWERVEKAYDAIVKGNPKTDDPIAYLKQSYDEGVTDEFIVPTALGAYEGMADGDGLLMANFRADRARQILTALLDPNFDDFKRATQIHFASTLGLREYSQSLNQWMETIYPSQEIKNSLGEIVSKQGWKQLRIAETEKYAHVTFFFNGGHEECFEGEDRILIPSPKVATYDLQPEMSAYEVTDQLVNAIRSEQYALIVVNYANTDMVGHTGNFEAARQAVEAVDLCLGRVKEAVEETGACLILTADHGNAEVMEDVARKSPHTAHTLSPVPFVAYNGPHGVLRTGKLSDIAPTVLEVLGVEKPSTMTGRSLWENKNG